MSLKVQKYDVSIYQGEDADILSFKWLQPDRTPIDLTGCQVRMQIRAVTGDLLLDRSLNDGVRITDSVIYISVRANEIATIAVRQGVYDVFITDSLGMAHKVLFGEVRIIQAVTR